MVVRHFVDDRRGGVWVRVGRRRRAAARGLLSPASPSIPRATLSLTISSPPFPFTSSSLPACPSFVSAASSLSSTSLATTPILWSEHTRLKTRRQTCSTQCIKIFVFLYTITEITPFVSSKIHRMCMCITTCHGKYIKQTEQKRSLHRSHILRNLSGRVKLSFFCRCYLRAADARECCLRILHSCWRRRWWCSGWRSPVCARSRRSPSRL